MGSSNTFSKEVWALGCALLGYYVRICVNRFKELKQYRAILEGLKEECEHNIFVLSEIVEGAVKRNVSFKRLNVSFFNEMQTDAVRHCAGGKLLRLMSQVNSDEALFNKELDAIENVTLPWSRRAFAKYCIVAARVGVEGSLTRLAEGASSEMHRLSWVRMALKSLV